MQSESRRLGAATACEPGLLVGLPEHHFLVQRSAGESSVFVTLPPPLSLLRTRTGAHSGAGIAVFSKGFASSMRTSETAPQACSGL